MSKSIEFELEEEMMNLEHLRSCLIMLSNATSVDCLVGLPSQEILHDNVYFLEQLCGHIYVNMKNKMSKFDEAISNEITRKAETPINKSINESDKWIALRVFSSMKFYAEHHNGELPECKADLDKWLNNLMDDYEKAIANGEIKRD